MGKTVKVKSIIITIFLIVLFFVLIDIIPFVFLWVGLSAKSPSNQISLQKWAVKTSVLRFQKIYTINSVLPILVLSGDHVTAIKYFENLELLDGADSINTRLIIYSFIQTGDFDNALKYAQLIGDKKHIAQIYIKKKDYKMAANVVDGMLLDENVKPAAYLYKSELLYNDCRYSEANNYVDKALKLSPSYIDGLYMKSKILAKFGNASESKKYFSKAKYLESVRTEIYN